MLLFKKKYLDAIRAGTRLWKHRRMRSGQRSYIPGIGYIDVATVEEVRLEDLTDEDARPDGFATADALRAELAEFYAEQLADGYQAYRVTFKVQPKSEPDSPESSPL